MTGEQKYGIAYYNKLTGRTLSGGGWFCCNPKDKEKEAVSMVESRTGLKYKKNLLNRIKAALTGYSLYELNETEDGYYEECSGRRYVGRDIYGNIISENWYSRCRKMIDFSNFILGKSGIEVQSIDEALALIEVCVDNDVDCTFVTPYDYIEFPYWHVKDGELEAARRYMADEVCDIWTYSDFAEEHER